MSRPHEDLGPSGDFQLDLGQSIALVCKRCNARLFEVWLEQTDAEDLLFIGIGASREDAIREALAALDPAVAKLRSELEAHP